MGDRAAQPVALATVLEQFRPTLRRAERLRFGSFQGETSVGHEITEAR